MKKTPLILASLTLGVLGLGLTEVVVRPVGVLATEASTGDGAMSEVTAELTPELEEHYDELFGVLDEDWRVVRSKYDNGEYATFSEKMRNLEAISARIKALRYELAEIRGTKSLRKTAERLKVEMEVFCRWHGVFVPDLGPEEILAVDDAVEAPKDCSCDNGPEDEDNGSGDKTENEVGSGGSDGGSGGGLGGSGGNGGGTSTGNNTEVGQWGNFAGQGSGNSANGSGAVIGANTGSGSGAQLGVAGGAFYEAIGGSGRPIENSSAVEGQLENTGGSEEVLEDPGEALESPEKTSEGSAKEIDTPHLGGDKQGWPWWLWLVPGAILVLAALMIRRCWQRN